MPRTFQSQAQEGRSVFALLRVLAIVGGTLAIVLIALNQKLADRTLGLRG